MRELIVKGTPRGPGPALARGQRLGPPASDDARQVPHTPALLAQPEATIAFAATVELGELA